MDVGIASLRSEAVLAMKTALVSVDTLQLTLKPEPSQEEQALTHHASSRSKEAQKDRYSTRQDIPLQWCRTGARNKLLLTRLEAWALNKHHLAEIFSDVL